jgi:hypothetical protein
MSTPRMESPNGGMRTDSPRLDSYRYSLINLEESLENDLDAILGELCALESNFAYNGSSGSSKKSENSSVGGDVTPVIAEAPPPVAPLQLEELLASEPQYISPESVRQNKLALAAAQQQLKQHQKQQQQQQAPRTDSPDNDSAFCEENTDSNSSNSSNGKTATVAASAEEKHIANVSNNNANVSSIGRNTSVTSSLKMSPSSEKAEKIRLAIEKMKEASVKKIFIKVFGEDGSAKSLLVDERMSVAMVCRLLAEKNHVKRDTRWVMNF